MACRAPLRQDQPVGDDDHQLRCEGGQRGLRLMSVKVRAGAPSTPASAKAGSDFSGRARSRPGRMVGWVQIARPVAGVASSASRQGTANWRAGEHQATGDGCRHAGPAARERRRRYRRAPSERMRRRGRVSASGAVRASFSSLRRMRSRFSDCGNDEQLAVEVVVEPVLLDAHGEQAAHPSSKGLTA